MRSAFRMVLLSLSGLGSAVPAWAQDGGWDGWWSMCGNWGMWGIGMMVGMLAFWGLVIAGVVVGIRWLVTQGTSRGGAAPRTGPWRSCATGTLAERSTRRSSTPRRAISPDIGVDTAGTWSREGQA